MNVVSLVGWPNTGKSALFNRIAKKRVAIVFDHPGVARDHVTSEVDVCVCEEGLVCIPSRGE